MFLKLTYKKYKDKTYHYATIVESVRKGNKTTHRVVQNIGRIRTKEDLETARKIEQSYKKGYEQREKILRLGDVSITQTREYGLLYAADELWTRHGIHQALRHALSDTRCEFDLERVIFLLSVNRLYEPGSDLSALGWIKDKAYPGLEVEAEKQWIYRSLDKLAENKERVEIQVLKNLKKSLGLSLDLVFYDLTSTYFEGIGPKLAMYGYSRDHRPDKKQIIVGVVMAQGIPIAHRVWPGNTADKSTLQAVARDLKHRLGIDNVVFIADRGMISSHNIEELEDLGYSYILSTKRRRDNLVKELLTREIQGPGDEVVLAQEIEPKGMDDGKKGRDENGDGNERRYILCLNKERRSEELERLEEIRQECDTKLEELGERFHRSQREAGKGRRLTKKGVLNRVERILGSHKKLFKINIDIDNSLEWELDREAWLYEKAIAGKFLLVTTTHLDPWQVMTAYKNLQDVEHAFNELKNLLKLRPLYHRLDKRVCGHVMICHLALLTKRLITQGTYSNQRLDKLRQIKIHQLDLNGEKVWMRNQITDSQAKILSKLGLAQPPKQVQEPAPVL